jgi:hypothetical protein
MMIKKSDLTEIIQKRRLTDSPLKEASCLVLDEITEGTVFIRKRD